MQGSTEKGSCGRACTSVASLMHNRTYVKWLLTLSIYAGVSNRVACFHVQGEACAAAA
jgi:hypothetical protein